MMENNNKTKFSHGWVGQPEDAPDLRSKEAFESSSEIQKFHSEEVVSTLLSFGERGGTKDEIAGMANINDIQVARQMRRLHDAGRVVITKMIRNSASGRKCTVWGHPGFFPELVRLYEPPRSEMPNEQQQSLFSMG